MVSGCKKRKDETTDQLEIQQNEMKRLNEKFNVEIFSSHVRGGKAYVAEQKIIEFKKLLFKSKEVHNTRQFSH